ncbi:MAG: hypothetical protein K9M10_00795 [Candidatus Pacebacteria bacterium]|nr:hypothetical protein [Candidatus Paceibacterota bacterium]MCF7857000.1 hypothetical protein [Candidatus Paceibacterota bacterium]
MKRNNWFLPVVAVLALVTSGYAFAASCTKHEQKGCLEIQVLNVSWEKGNSNLQGLDGPPKDDDDRLRRTKSLGPDLLKAYERGDVEAAAPRSYHVFFWKPNMDITTEAMASWRLNGKIVSRGDVEEVTGKVPGPKSTGLGEPNRVYRVWVTGEKAFALSFQAPWDLFTKDTVIMVTPEGGKSVHPGNGKALWIMPKYLNETIRVGAWDWVLMAFVLNPE